MMLAGYLISKAVTYAVGYTLIYTFSLFFN